MQVQNYKIVKKLFFEAVKQNGYSLQNASLEMQNDREIVLKAVRQNGTAIRFANTEFRSDKEVILEAVKQNGFLLQYASEELLRDKEILFSRNFLHREVDDRGFAMKSVGKNRFQEKCFKGSFDELIFHEFLGRGCYGSTYRCTRFGDSSYIWYVAKINNNLYVDRKKKEEILSRDCLFVPHHDNVVTIIKHWPNVTIDLYKLPDYESYWKGNCLNDKRYVNNCGVILMNFHNTTLKRYLDCRMKKNERFGTSEIRKMFWGLLCGVCHLHENMIVHRDLHCENIFVYPKYIRILIGDFGCCLDLRNNPTKFKVQKDHEMMFSFTNDTLFKKEVKNGEIGGFKKGGYSKMIPPEIQNFDPLIDEYLDYSKSDIYSLGVLGFILLDHQKREEDDFKLEEFLKKLKEEDHEKRLGCSEAKEVGKFIEERL